MMYLLKSNSLLCFILLVRELKKKQNRKIVFVEKRIGVF